MADVTAKETRLNGVNSDSSFVREEAYIFDVADLTDLKAVGTHSIVKFDKEDAVVGLKVVFLTGVTSSGSATLQFKADFNGTAEALHTAIAIANCAAGDVHTIHTNAVKGYDGTYGCTLQLTVATAALTAGKFMVIAELVPVKRFLENG